MPDFDILVSTGKYDRWPLVAADRKKYGADKVGTFSTEAGRFTDATLAATFGLDAVRGGTGGTEVVVTLPPEFSPAGEPYDHQLSDLTYSHDAAHGGKPYPPFAVLVRPAIHDKTGVLVDFIGGHLALPNTPRRVEVSNDSLFGATGLTALVSSIRAEGRHVVVGLDTNLAWKNPDDRALLQKVARATGCVWALDGRVPTTKRSLIDNVLTSLPVRSVRLIDPVKSSDHPWTAAGLSVPAPAPVPPPTPVEKPMSSGYQTDLVDALKGSGLKVVEQPGWKTRGHGGFSAVEAIVCHHTAGPASGNMPSLGVVTNGRAGLAGPLCNFGLGRDGTVYVVAAGVAWHAGVVSNNAYSNTHALGIEAEATGTGSWPEAQMDAYARLCRALCNYYDIPVSRVLGHKEVASPRGRKIDPNFDMGAFRGRVQAVSPTPARQEPTLSPAQKFKAALLAACADAKKNVPASRTAVHAGRKVVEAFAVKIK